MEETFQRLVQCVAHASRHVHDTESFDRDLEIAMDLTNDLIHSDADCAFIRPHVLDSIRMLLYDIQCFSHETHLAKTLIGKLQKMLSVAVAKTHK